MGRKGRVTFWFGVLLILVAVLLLLGTQFLAGTVAFVARTSGFPRVHHLDVPGHEPAVLELRGGWSPDARLWIGPPPLDPASPRFEVSLWCDGRPALCLSDRSGRYLVADRRAVVGGILDLKVPSFVGDPRRFPPIEELRAEFGEDLWFPAPDWIDEPLEPGE